MRGFGPPSGPVTPIPPQDLTEVSKNWPIGNVDIRIGDYMFRPHQKWTITPVANAGGYPRLAVFQDHNRGYRSNIGGNRRTVKL